MLGKMLLHGLIAAVIVGAAAAVYAQTRGDPPLSVLAESGHPHAMGHDDD